MGLPVGGGGGCGYGYEQERAQRLAGIGALEEVLNSIRKLPGLEPFHLPLLPATVASFASDGPIIIMTCMEVRSDAHHRLHLHYPPPTAVPPHSDAESAMLNLSGSITAGGSLRTYRQRSQRSQRMTTFLTYLWRTAVAPVIQAPAEMCIINWPLRPRPVRRRPPRVWWIGVGILHNAPFHAAGEDHLRSHLLLRGAEPLTAAAIVAVSVQQDTTPMAYPPACSTAGNPSMNLVNEGINAASAFQMACMGHVLGNLWAAEDAACVAVSERFYAALFTQGEREGHASVERAFHVAVRSIRDEKIQRSLA